MSVMGYIKRRIEDPALWDMGSLCSRIVFRGSSKLGVYVDGGFLSDVGAADVEIEILSGFIGGHILLQYPEDFFCIVSDHCRASGSFGHSENSFIKLGAVHE